MSVRKRRWITRTGEEREVWVVDYVAQDGSRHLKTFAKKKAADAFHSQVNVDVAAGIHTPHSKSITVAEAADNWLAQGRGP
jgi:MinD superfamily P-loop ATPase